MADNIIEDKTDNPPASINNKGSRHRWLETFSTILLSAATVLSAWCMYESSQWNGEQYFRIEDESMADRKRMQKEISSHQRLSADAMLFLQYVTSITDGNTTLRDFLGDRFPEHLKVATLAWHKMDPLNNPDAPVSPMHMKEYVLPEEADIIKYADEAKAFKMQANTCDNHSDNYMLLSLVLSMVLFFCGLSGVLDSRSNQMILISFATLIFLITIFFVISFPVLI